MKTESLSPGQNPAEIGAGGSAGFGEARDLGPGEVEKMFGPVPTPEQRLAAQGVEFVESEAERGGGGGDPVEGYFKKVDLGKAQKFIAEQQGKNYPDASSIKLPDGTSIEFGEYKKIATAIQDAQVRDDRRPVEDIILEARRPEPQPEPQPTPRPADWRDSLSPEQKERLNEFEVKIKGFDIAQLQNLLARIKQLQALSPVDGWQGKGIQEKDAEFILRLIIEQLEKMSRGGDNGGELRKITKSARITGWRPPPDELDPRIDLSTGTTTNGIQ